MIKKGSLGKIAVLTIVSLGAVSAWRLLGTAPPREDTGCLDRIESRVETFTTEDGITLKLKRYVNEGAQPILLAHGFNGNGLEFDLPHHEHNLALFLAERGYDVWISSFRGCGREPYVCENGGWSHSIDHLAALDAPALIAGVREATGRKPIWIGHSMGGVVLYMLLQGIRISGDGSGFEIAADPELVRERNDSILGGVTIGSPPTLLCGGGDWVAKLQRLSFIEPGAKRLLRLLKNIETISPRMPISTVGDVSARFPRVGRLLATRSPIATALYNVDNIDPDVGYSLLKWASDNVTTRMTTQFVTLVLDPEFKDYNGEYNYTTGMPVITAPIFFITGTEDFVGPDNVHEYGYEKVSSKVKRFENYRGYGHTDLVMGKRVYEEVYPDILDWIEDLARGYER